MKYAFSTARQTLDKYGQEVTLFEDAYAHYLYTLGYHTIVIPSSSDLTLLEGFQADLILLTGGGDAPAEYFDSNIDVQPQNQRDGLEKKLIEYATAFEIPLLGICRGMQMLNGYFGGYLSRTALSERRIATTHSIKTKEGFSFLANSYHQDTIKVEALSPTFEIIALHEDGKHVEAILNANKRILGIQWHPERMLINDPCKEYTSNLIKNYITVR